MSTTGEKVAGTEFLNRELSWLEFNRRVLQEALDERTPLLERVKFLSIFHSNLDEFFMKRVGGLKRQIDARVMSRTPDGRTPPETLTAVREMVVPMLCAQADGYLRSIRAALAVHGIRLLEWEELSDRERETADRYFQTHVFPVLTPLAVDPGHPFPFISNLSTSLGVTLRHPGRGEKLFARIKVPQVLPPWVSLSQPEGAGGFRFVRLIDLIRHNLGDLFREMEVENTMPFRVTRNADVERDEEDADDLLEMIEQEVHRRRFERAVRLEHGPQPDPWMLSFLMHELGLSPADVYEMPAELNYGDLDAIAEINRPDLKYAPWHPVVSGALTGAEPDLFALIRRGDLLVHHPYESFAASIERFVDVAAADPHVRAIKMTVYRTGDESPFMHTLIRAAEAGKQVVCLVEVKARFDEERNIFWAQALEDAGVHVVYGLVGLKTHSKTTLVVRDEPDGLRCYAHIGTGNYHVETARLYTDLGLLTCKAEFTEDLIELFNYLTGRSLQREYRKLLVAPVNMKTRFLELINREAAHCRNGQPARIVAKMNSLEDREICQALYRASSAGVRIELIVRGFCCLRPGVPGLSENISVISVIGRFLEHSRIFYFRNGAEDPLDGECYIGSADWMYRNLAARVEVVCPVEDRPLRRQCWEILQVMLRDRRQAWDMQSDGSYVQRTPASAGSGPEVRGTQETLMELALATGGTRSAQQQNLLQFEDAERRQAKG